MTRVQLKAIAAAGFIGTILASTSVLASDPSSASDAVVASRGGVTLTLADVDAKIRSMPPDLRSGYLTEPDRIARLVESMLLSKQVAAEGAKNGLDQDPEFIADVAMLRTELLANRQVRKQAMAFVPPPLEQLAKERYLADPKAFAPPPRIDIRHFLVDTDGRDEAKAKSLAEEFVRRAKAGEDFLALVTEYTEKEGDAVRSDLISNADPKRLDPQFAVAMSQLEKPGDLVGPVRSRFGYHVIRLEALDIPPPPPFEQVQEKLIAELREGFIQKERNRYLAEYSRLPAEINGEVVRQLPTRYAKLEAAEPSAKTAGQVPASGDSPE